MTMVGLEHRRSRLSIGDSTPLYYPSVRQKTSRSDTGPLGWRVLAIEGCVSVGCLVTG
jgi:hypothetical protein